RDRPKFRCNFSYAREQRSRLLQKAHQLNLLRQKRIVTVIARHLTIVDIRSGGAYLLSKAAHRVGGEEPVGADANEAEPRADTAVGLNRRSIAANRIPCIHRAQDGEIGIGIKAVDEALALVIEITGDVEAAADEATSAVQQPGVLAVAVGIAAKPFFEERRRLVADHGNLTRQPEPVAGWLLRQIAAALPLGIVLDGLTLQVIERKPHRAERRHAYNQRAVYPGWVKDSPFKGLHAADRAAQNQPQTADAERVKKLRLGADVVADRDEGKVGAVAFTGGGID